MIRARLVLAATTVALSIPAGVALFAQTPPAPDLHPILAGRSITPPLRGEAQVQVVWPPTSKRDKDSVVTKVQVKNISSGPIKGLEIDQPWYNKGGAVVASGMGVINGLLQPNEVQTITIEVLVQARHALEQLPVQTHERRRQADQSGEVGRAARGSQDSGPRGQKVGRLFLFEPHWSALLRHRDEVIGRRDDLRGNRSPAR